MTTSDERSLTSRDFPVHQPVLTRWTDNDMFGHLNNAVFYEFYEAAINGWIISNTGIDPFATPWLGLVAESGCRYFSELRFPDPLVIGLSVARLGRTSVRYRLGVFQTAHGQPPGDTPIAALGHWVNVYVDRTTRRPVPIPDAIRALLDTARVEE